jgi:RNA polymerase sigma-70 factor (ECF subfamily)
VVRIVNRHVPYDAVEETAHNVFIRVYRSLPTYRGKGSFSQWISSVAVRTCHDFWRKHYRTRELPMSSLSEKHREWLENVSLNTSDQSFRERGKQEEARDVLAWALEKLSAEDRMVVELVYLEGLSVREAAELLGWSVANVKIRSFRIRKKLRGLLADFVEERRSI